jgi:hypothetical protein
VVGPATLKVQENAMSIPTLLSHERKNVFQQLCLKNIYETLKSVDILEGAVIIEKCGKSEIYFRMNFSCNDYKFEIYIYDDSAEWIRYQITALFGFIKWRKRKYQIFEKYDYVSKEKQVEAFNESLKTILIVTCCHSKAKRNN